MNNTRIPPLLSAYDLASLIFLYDKLNASKLPGAEYHQMEEDACRAAYKEVEELNSQTMKDARALIESIEPDNDFDLALKFKFEIEHCDYELQPALAAQYIEKHLKLTQEAA